MQGRRTLVAAIGVVAAAAPGRKVAAAEDRVVVTPAQAPAAAAAEHFTGSATVSAAFAAQAPARASGGTVQFAPAARTDWHTHPLGQTLVVLSGTGFVQHWGGSAEHLVPGDVAWIPPGTKHWHGAGPAGPMVHVAISERMDGKTVDWLEKVSEAQYAEAVRS